MEDTKLSVVLRQSTPGNSHGSNSNTTETQNGGQSSSPESTFATDSLRATRQLEVGAALLREHPVNSHFVFPSGLSFLPVWVSSFRIHLQSFTVLLSYTWRKYFVVFILNFPIIGGGWTLFTFISCLILSFVNWMALFFTPFYKDSLGFFASIYTKKMLACHICNRYLSICFHISDIGKKLHLNSWLNY